ncbi:MAG: CvpA family protein [Thermomicrobiales bacterium]|nr:CvpA family protein [Thermomicrobiales bacterium]
MGSLVLDFLLVIIFLMMVPIGFYRGGLRELCTAAGLLLGILMAQAWGSDWSSLFTRMFGWTPGAAEFLMSVLIVVAITALIGYGGSAAFSYRPGPGGRLYGAFLALFNAMILAGYLINLYGETIVPGGQTKPVTSGIVARTLSEDFGTILLIATLGVACSTIFGMFVRDRASEIPVYQAPPPALYQQNQATRPYQPETVEPAPREPVRIREVNEWQSDAEPQRANPATYGSGWRQTWPDATPAQQRNTRTAGTPSTRATPPAEPKPDSSSRKVLADWMKDQDES